MKVICACVVSYHQRHLPDPNIPGANVVERIFRGTDGIFGGEKIPNILLIQKKQFFRNGDGHSENPPLGNTSDDFFHRHGVCEAEVIQVSSFQGVIRSVDRRGQLYNCM